MTRGAVARPSTWYHLLWCSPLPGLEKKRVHPPGWGGRSLDERLFPLLHKSEETMNLNIIQTLFLALLQGVTELFPISSLGHTVIFPGLFGWGNLLEGTACDGQSCFLPLIVALHLGTAVALVLYFWRDWLQVGKTLVSSVKEGEVRKGTEEWVCWLIIIGCIPAGLIGVFLQDPLEKLFASPLLAA